MRIVKELVGKEVLGNDIISMGKVVDVELVIPFDMINKIGDKIILKDVFDEDLAQMEDEIEDLKSQL